MCYTESTLPLLPGITELCKQHQTSQQRELKVVASGTWGCVVGGRGQPFLVANLVKWLDTSSRSMGAFLIQAILEMVPGPLCSCLPDGWFALLLCEWPPPGWRVLSWSCSPQ